MSFAVVFTTQPSFLRSRFPTVREVLMGVIDVVEHKEPKFSTLAIPPQVSVRVRASQTAVSSISNSKTKKKTSVWRPLFAAASFVAAISITAVFIGPGLYFYLFPADITPIEALEKGSVLGGRYEEGSSSTAEVWQPPIDTSLPTGSWIVIPKIGVRTELQRTADSEEALRNGVWWVPDFGTAGDREKPMIVAAHRYGYQWWWKSEYWRYHSFYLLPELKPGDIVEIIHDQRKWTYEIYAGEEGDEISDYSADMILYTCKFLNSPLRHFRYARIVNTQQDSQKVTTS